MRLPAASCRQGNTAGVWERPQRRGRPPPPTTAGGGRAPHRPGPGGGRPPSPGRAGSPRGRRRRRAAAGAAACPGGGRCPWPCPNPPGRPACTGRAAFGGRRRQLDGRRCGNKAGTTSGHGRLVEYVEQRRDRPMPVLLVVVGIGVPHRPLLFYLHFQFYESTNHRQWTTFFSDPQSRRSI